MSETAPKSPHQNDYTFYDGNYKPMWNRGIGRTIGASAFTQQTLATYHLSWSPLKICPVLLIMGALLTGMGVGIKKFADSVEEVTIPYTHCNSIENASRTCYAVLKNATEYYRHKFGVNVDAAKIENCTCDVGFTLKEPINGTVYVHYTLTNFFQNHLKYYVSRDENQLKGNLFDYDDDDKDEMTPIPREPSGLCGKEDDMYMDGRIIYPCGLMANSMFTDVIKLFYHSESELIDNYSQIRTKKINVPLKKTGIAWESDRTDKYENPKEFDNETHPIWKNYTKPKGWKTTLWQLDPFNQSNNGVKNEDFIVWMRASAFPWFRKLHRILDSKFHPFEKGLPAGNYTLWIEYNYEVSSFNGEKSIILTTTSMVAGKNMFLAIVYMAAGALCIFLAIVLFVVHKLTRGTKSSEMKQD